MRQIPIDAPISDPPETTIHGQNIGLTAIWETVSLMARAFASASRMAIFSRSITLDHHVADT
jgi:hypothetical protein